MLNSSSFLYKQLALVSNFGSDKYLLAFVIIIPVLFLYFKNYRKESFLLLLSTVSFVLDQILKGYFRIPRPEGALVEIFSPFDIYGFPSGHTLFYTAFFGFIFYLTFKLKKIDKLIRHVTRVFCIYLVLFVGVSRVLLGVHSIFDVLGGYGFGLLFVSVWIWLDRNLPLKGSGDPGRENKKKDS